MREPHHDTVLLSTTFEVRWSDCDANKHMRHSAYADMAAHTRVKYLESLGLTDQWMKEHQIGPVLFKETTEYFREAHLSDVLTVNVEAGEPTGSDKTITLVCNLYKSDGELAASVSVLSAWIDLVKRKVVPVPEPVHSAPVYQPAAATV